MIIFLAIVYIAIGFIRIRRVNGSGGFIAMIAHNNPNLGLLMLVSCILFWPIDKIVLIVITAFIKD